MKRNETVDWVRHGARVDALLCAPAQCESMGFF